nr:MAG TPA: hypothetical protein [Caudoviricetes sp.]
MCLQKTPGFDSPAGHQANCNWLPTPPRHSATTRKETP